MIRHLDTDAVEVAIDANAAWKEKAKKALEAVEKKSGDERAAAIDKKQTVWKDLKSTLAKASYNKCWYCGSEEPRSDMAIDHFRPKNRVAECPDHPGYWWLAFDWENYRYSCNYCNSPHGTAEDATKGGKQDHFPLFESSPRAYKPEDNWRAERPVLLDPVVPGDAVLLVFMQDGTPWPRFSLSDNPIAYRRATVSIDVYHLKHNRLTEKRAEIYRQMRSYVRMGDEGIQDMSSNLPLGEHKRNQAIIGIKQLTRHDAPFAAAAADYLDTFRINRKWLEGVC